MEKSLYELDYIEQELAELRNNLEHSFEVIDGLAKVQLQFEDLAQTYHQLTEHIDQVKANREYIVQVQSTVNHRFGELEKVINFNRQASDSKLSELQDDLETTNLNFSNYNAELAKQSSEIEEKVEKRLTDFLKEWESYKKTIQNLLYERVDSRLDTKIEALRNQLSDAGFNSQNLQKLKKLEAELNLSKLLRMEVEQKLRATRNLTIVTGITVALAFVTIVINLLTTTT